MARSLKSCFDCAVLVCSLQSPAELWSVLHHSLRQSLDSGDVKLIVMDSVAAMFRTEHDGTKELDFGERSEHATESTRPRWGSVYSAWCRVSRLLVCVRVVFAPDRSQDLLRMAAQLKQYSSTYHIPVLVINQVSDFFAGADANNGDALRMDQVKHSYDARTGNSARTSTRRCWTLADLCLSSVVWSAAAGTCTTGAC